MTSTWFNVTPNANDTWPEAHYRGALCYRVVTSLLLCSGKGLCRGRVEGHFIGYPSHKTYTCQFEILYIWLVLVLLKYITMHGPLNVKFMFVYSVFWH